MYCLFVMVTSHFSTLEGAMGLLNKSFSFLLRVQCNESKKSLAHSEHKLDNSDFAL